MQIARKTENLTVFMTSKRVTKVHINEPIHFITEFPTSLWQVALTLPSFAAVLKCLGSTLLAQPNLY